MTDDIHSCSPYCNRPACVKEQRDKLLRKVAELEQSADLHYKSHAAAIAKLAESEKRVAELEADARRYRWLRTRNELREGDTPFGPYVIEDAGDIEGTFFHLTGAQIDTAIDDAIGAEGEE